MSSTDLSCTAKLALPYIAPSQAQKHVTHNEALAMLDALVQLSALSMDLGAPPAAAADGDRYIVAAPATGAWSGKAGHLAVRADGAWRFHAPQAGWLCHVADRAALMLHDGVVWAALPAPVMIDNLTRLGIGTTADTTNRLALAAPASLFSHAGTDHRLKLNKAAAANTASIVMQSNWSGRAEIGLTGDDVLRVKVSADGTLWQDALRIDPATARVSFPAAGMRETLFAPRIYYVSPAGADSANGLTPATALLTLQAAINLALSIDPNGYAVTIQLADGTYGGATMARGLVDGGVLAITGNVTTPAAVQINGGASNALRIDGAGTQARLEGVRLTGASGVLARLGAYVMVRGQFSLGVCTVRHFSAETGAFIDIFGTLTVDGNALQHIFAGNNGMIQMTGCTVVLTATPQFVNGFAAAQLTGTAIVHSNTYSGAATGPRYRAQLNGVVFANSGGPDALPGNAAGSVATGGQYQ